MEIVYDQMRVAAEADQLEQLNYLRGVLRGVKMVEETYKICLKSEERMKAIEDLEDKPCADKSLFQS